MIVELDLRAVAELVLEIFGETTAVIRIGLQRRADEIDVADGDARLLQAKADGAAWQLAAYLLPPMPAVL